MLKHVLTEKSFHLFYTLIDLFLQYLNMLSRKQKWRKIKSRPLPDAFDGDIEDGLGFESHTTQSLPKSDLRNLPT